jgi:CubicO group peptidase (beta-lactamase class C family)
MRQITEQPSYIIHEQLGIEQSNWDQAEHLATGQLSMHKLFKTVALETDGTTALQYAQAQLDVNSLIVDDPLMPGRKMSGEQLLNRRVFNDGLLVMHRDQVIHESYRNGMTADDRHVIHSCTKSLCSMLVAITIEQGLLDPCQLISHYIPEFKTIKAWDDVTLQQVLDMQAGIEYSEDYTDPNAHYWSYARAAGYYPPLANEAAIGAKAWMFANMTKRSHQPGTAFVYNSCLANVLGMALENVHRKHLAEIFEQLLYQPAGAEHEGYFNTDPMGFPIVEGQLNLKLQDFARCAAIMLNEGKNLNGERILPLSFIEQTIKPKQEDKNKYQAVDKSHVFPSGQYKNQFWVLNPEQRQFAMLGIHGQFAWYDLNRKLMIVGNGSFPSQSGTLLTQSLKTLWLSIAQQISP